MPNTAKPPSHPLLKTRIWRLAYDFISRHGIVFTTSSVDMNGAIATFCSIDPLCESIEVNIDFKESVHYFKLQNEWNQQKLL